MLFFMNIFPESSCEQLIKINVTKIEYENPVPVESEAVNQNNDNDYGKQDFIL